MQFLKEFLIRVYTAWVIIVFSVFMLILLPGIIIPILFGHKYGRITFIRYEVIGRERIDRKRSYIYTSNHTSFLDIPGLNLGIPTQFRPLAKKELLKIPVFGFIVRVATVVVDRSSTESRRKSIDLLKGILEKGISILIFPEGTQNRTNMPLQPFFDGPFRIAIQTETPILPIIITNAGNLMPPNRLKVRPGKIKVIFGDPIEVTGMENNDLHSLKSHTRDVMLSIIEKHHKR